MGGNHYQLVTEMTLLASKNTITKNDINEQTHLPASTPTLASSQLTSTETRQPNVASGRPGPEHSSVYTTTLRHETSAAPTPKIRQRMTSKLSTINRV